MHYCFHLPPSVVRVLGQNERSKNTSPRCLLQPVWGTARTFPSWKSTGVPGQGQCDGVRGKGSSCKGKNFLSRMSY